MFLKRFGSRSWVTVVRLDESLNEAVFSGFQRLMVYDFFITSLTLMHLTKSMAKSTSVCKINSSEILP